MLCEAPFKLEGVMMKAADGRALGIDEVGSSRRAWLKIRVLGPSIYRRRRSDESSFPLVSPRP